MQEAQKRVQKKNWSQAEGGMPMKSDFLDYYV